MHSSVGIIVGLASRAPLTIFDEPYLGLDAVSRNIFYGHLLEDYAEYPRTVVLSSHLIDEVSQLLEHVIVIDKGTILINEDAELLRGRAFTVAGSAAEVESFLVGKTVISRDPFGALLSATVDGTLHAEDRKQAMARGLEFGSVSLQQLIIHLTNGKTERKAADL